MLIKETTLRRIIREEAQRVLREQVTTVAQDGGVNASTGPITRDEMLGASAQNDQITQYMNYDTQGVRGAITRAVDVVRKYNANVANAIIPNYEKFFMAGLMSPFNQIMGKIVDLGDSIGHDAKARMVIAAFAGFPQNRSLTGGAFLPADEYLGLTGAMAGTGPQVALNKAIGDSKKFLEGVFYMASYDIAAMVRKTLSPPAATVPAAPAAAAAAAPAPVKSSTAPAQDWNAYLAAMGGPGTQVKNAWESIAPRIGWKNNYLSFATWWQRQKKNNSSWKGSPADTITALNAAVASKK